MRLLDVLTRHRNSGGRILGQKVNQCSSSAFGLDIGSYSVKAVEMMVTGDEISLNNFCIVNYPSRANFGSAEFYKNLTKALVEVKSKIPAMKNPVISLHGKSVWLGYAQLPPMSDKELAKAVKFQIPDHFNPEDYYITWSLTKFGEGLRFASQESGDNQKEIYLVYALSKKSLVDALLTHLKAIGLEPAAIDLDSFALENVYRAENENVLSVVALINIGASTTNINVLKDGASLYAGDMSVGGDDFTHSIQNKLGMSFPEAEKLKISKEFISSNGGKCEVQVHLENGWKTFSSELKTFFSKVRKNFPNLKIDEIQLCGGSCRMRNIDRLLEQELGIPVAFLKLNKNILFGRPDSPTHPRAVEEKPLVGNGLENKTMLELGVAVGLALRGLGEKYAKN